MLVGGHSELSNKYQHDRVKMVFKNLCVLVLLTKILNSLSIRRDISAQFLEPVLCGIYFSSILEPVLCGMLMIVYILAQFLEHVLCGMLMIVYISAKFSEPFLYGMLMIVYISAQFSEPVLYGMLMIVYILAQFLSLFCVEC